MTDSAKREIRGTCKRNHRGCMADKPHRQKSDCIGWQPLAGEPAGGSAAVEEEWMREAAKEFVYNVHAWRGRSPEFMLKQLGRLTAIIAEHAASRTRALASDSRLLQPHRMR